MALQPRTTVSVEEYLAFERESEIRHEYDGEAMYAMSGGTEQHTLISGNVFASLYTQFRRRDCKVYGSDMRVHIPTTGLYTYPDISALCGTAQFQDLRRDTLLNPLVIVEVLSPSTEAYDRGVKFRNYRAIPSLQEYILIAQDTVLVEHYVRQSDGQWLLNEVSDLAGSIMLPSIDCTLALADIYEKVLDT